MQKWISVIKLPVGTNGVSGGKKPWTLQVIRLSPGSGSSHWWEVNREITASGLTTYRDHDGEICMIELASRESFENAAVTHNLNTLVFGSPTLWPCIHHSASRDSQEIGWAWTFSEHAPFPFR